MEKDKVKWDDSLDVMAKNMPEKPIVMLWIDDSGAIKSSLGAFNPQQLALAKHMLVKRIDSLIDSGLKEN